MALAPEQGLGQQHLLPAAPRPHLPFDLDADHNGSHRHLNQVVHHLGCGGVWQYISI